MEDKTFYTLATFDYASDAELLKSKLESEDIPVWLKDANILYAQPFITTAVGGVKVQVPLAYKDQAQVIYDALRAYALDAQGKPLKCPNCKAERLERYLRRDKVWYRLFPFFAPLTYKCLSCGMLTTIKP
jgi:DNA-directed RNA polymerase subunit RPC12/RpoP